MNALSTVGGSAAAPGELRTAVLRAVATATARLAPKLTGQQVATNEPLPGFAECTLLEAAYRAARTSGRRLARPRQQLQHRLETGVIEPVDIDHALTELASELPTDMHSTRVLALAKRPAEEMNWQLPTLLTLASARSQGDWVGPVLGSIENWAVGFFDPTAQAGAKAAPLAAYLETTATDRTTELVGMRKARSALAAVPTDPVELLVELVSKLDLPAFVLEDYFLRLLSDVSTLVVGSRARTATGESLLLSVLAIRGAWELVLLSTMKQRQAWDDRQRLRGAHQ